MNGKKERDRNAEKQIAIEGINKRLSRPALGTAFYRLESRDTWFGILDDFLE